MESIENDNSKHNWEYIKNQLNKQLSREVLDQQIEYMSKYFQHLSLKK